MNSSTTVVLALILGSCFIGCIREADVSKNVRMSDPIRFDREFRPILPYRQIVRSVAQVREYYTPTDYRYSAFASSVNQINQSILGFAADLYSLPIDQKTLQLANYDKLRTEVTSKYFRDLKALLNKPEYMPSPNSVFSYPTYTAVEAFGEVLSRSICDIVGMILSAYYAKPVLSIGTAALNGPCEKLLAMAVNPILEEMANQALIEDHLLCRLTIENHVREMIFQLATVQDKMDGRFETSYEKKIIFDIFKSKASLKTRFNATVKAGFDLSKYFRFDIDDSKREFIITLPEPQILSADIDYKIAKMENGWFIDVDERRLNEAFAIARNRIVLEAAHSGLLEKAKQNANMIVNAIFGPAAEMPQLRYKVQVRFEPLSSSLGGKVSNEGR